MTSIATEAAELIEKKLARLDRTPFRRELAKVVGCAPTVKNITEWAEKYPDRWGQLVVMLAGLSGFAPGINVNIRELDPAMMSDVELMEFVSGMSGRLRELARGRAGEVVDVTPLPPQVEGPKGSERSEDTVPGSEDAVPETTPLPVEELPKEPE